jgi:phosphogluconate dehydratase
VGDQQHVPAMVAVQQRLPGPADQPVEIDERAIVNGIVGLLATGGSTNHTLHLVAMARAAGIAINWDDFSDLSAVVPFIHQDVEAYELLAAMNL